MVTEAVHRLWNGALTLRPERVVRCGSTEDVQVAVREARNDGLEISVLGGGHDWAGRAVRDGAVVLDLGGLRDVEIHGDTATIGGGATGSDVLDAAYPHGKAAVVGTVGSVGVVGLLLGGGLSPLSGVTGLGADNLLAAEVVLADGRVVSTGEEPELLWALRGGGGNFGVVTHAELRLHPFAEVTTGMIAFPWSEARAVFDGWHAITSDELDVMFGAMPTPGGLLFFTVPMWLGDPAQAQAQIDQVRGLGTPVIDQVALMPLAQSVHAIDELCPAGGHYYASTRTLPVPGPGARAAILEAAENIPPASMLNVHHLHGAAARPGDGAYAYRDEHLVVELIAVYEDSDGVEEKAWVRRGEEILEDHALPGGWPNLMRPEDPRGQQAFGDNKPRLRDAKRRYDPDNIWQGIPRL